MAELNRDAYTRYADFNDGHFTRNVPSNMLRAESSMSYLDFIAMVEYLWKRVHPDIPIRPVQSAAFERYPVIVYSLELRRPHQAEPKERYREQVMDGEGNIYSIRAQRFQNVISFSAIDRNNPETVEAIIEAFESFMFEYTPTLKKLGVSELFYSRRVSDSESTRSTEDTNVRTVQYMVTLEKIRYIKEDLLAEVLVDVRLYLDNNRSPGFSVEADQVGTPFITLWRNNFLVEVGDEVFLKSIDNSIYSFPKGITSYRKYTVSSISSDDSATPSRIVLGLQDSNGTPIRSSSTGQGAILHSILDNFDINIEDNAAAVPVPAFSPLDLSPTLWVDASDTSTITESGGAVSQWDDKSGNGYNLTQATGTAQPTTGTRTMNSLNVVDFDGSSDYMISGAFSPVLAQPNTIFLVFSVDIVTTSYPFDGLATDTTNRAALLLSNGQYQIFAGTLTARYGLVGTGSRITRTVFNGTSSSLHVDGSSVIAANAGTNSIGGLTIGARYSASSMVNGTFAELIVVNGTLTAQEISDTETYLADKWGITLQ